MTRTSSKEGGVGSDKRPDDMCGVSGALAEFVADFEAKILQPAREKRAASDPILAIRPVALGVVRDPEWEGVIDGEVCGIGALAESVRSFLHWVPIKLETREALRLCVSCGDALAREGEFTCAREFYRFVSATCECVERERAASNRDHYEREAEGADGREIQTGLTRYEACWSARAEFGVASLELRRTLTRDPHVRCQATLSKIVVHLQSIQRAMSLLLSLPKIDVTSAADASEEIRGRRWLTLRTRPRDDHNFVSWLVLEGSALLFEWCEPLSVLGHGGTVVEFLAWGILAMEAMVNLSTVKHLPWRTRLTAATCYAYEDAGDVSAAAKCAAHAMEKVGELRRQEGMDPPIPANILETLRVAEADLRLLIFKYSVLAAAIAKRPSAPANERGADGITGGGGGLHAVGGGGGGRGGLCEEDFLGFLDQHIPDATERPAALLELLGRSGGSVRGSSSSGGGGGGGGCELTLDEASTVCKCALSLVGPTGETAKGEAGGDPAGKGLVKKEGEATTPDMFPLDIDQEMQLMREVYKLGEFAAWEAMLPFTKQRLRDAKRSLSRNDCRAFWFEIALWTARKRLPTWKDKPERQVVSRGGLKRTPPGTATAPSAALSDDVNCAVAGGVVGHDISGGGGNETDGRVSGSDARGREGGERTGALAAGITAIVHANEVVQEVEEELSDALTMKQPAEVLEIPFLGPGGSGVKVNLTPLLTVVDLIRKAVFGQYRHVLEKRGEAALEAAMSVWKEYMVAILKALDEMPGEAEVERPLVDAVLMTLETISACLSALDADDVSLRATIALRLGILQADFRGDRRKACQTLRSALAAIDKHRQHLVSHQQHAMTTTTTTTTISSINSSSDHKRSVARGRTSVTGSFYDRSLFGHDGSSPREGESADDTRLDSGENIQTGLQEQDAEADMTFHELAALQLDITSTLFRVELLMGRDVAYDLACHKKAEAAAQLAKRTDASKRKKKSNKNSKVTFGDYEGQVDTPAGSLTRGWSVVPPPDTGTGGGDVLKALLGTDAVVCAAGVGQIPGRSSALEQAAIMRDYGTILDSAVEGLHAVGLNDGKPQVSSCPATEARLVAEFRRNPYARAVLLATMARFRTERSEQEGLITEAAGLLRQATKTEQTLLGMLPPRITKDSSYPTAGGTSSARTLSEGCDPKRGGMSTATQPPPFLLSRSHTSVELLPLPIPCQAKKASTPGTVGDKGRLGRHNAAISSNATSTRTAAAAARKDGKMKTTQRIAKVCVYGKPEGAGTGVTLSNTRYPGLGVPIPYDQETGLCGAVSIRGLAPNESYVFAVAAFDEHGDPIGDGVGETCAPVETLNPLPLPLCWAHLSRTALALGWSSLAGQSANEVYRELVASGTTMKHCTSRGGHHQPGRGNGSIGVTTDMRDGWMASPSLGHAFMPKALDRCPRAVLQAFVQACFVLVDTSDEEAMIKAGGVGGGGNGASLEEQVCSLVSLKRLSLACEGAVLLRDWDLVSRGVWRSYHLLLPLLGISAMGHLLFQVICGLHQCLSLVPKESWDDALKTTFTCLAYQITLKGHEIGEKTSAQNALMEHGPDPELNTAETIIFKVTAPNGEEEDGTTRNGNVPSQLALAEVWMGLPGYGMGGDALSKMKNALGMSEPVTGELSGKTGEGGEEERGRPIPSAVTLQAVEQVISMAHKSPSKAWELLMGEEMALHPDRIRLVCKVCRIALDRGMARQVISWLEPGNGSTGTVGDADSMEAPATRVSLLNASDIEPLTAKVLALEGALTTTPYIGPAERVVIEPEEANEGDGQASGAGTVNDRETKTLDEGSQNNKRTGAAQEDLGGLTPSPAESYQLLWLAEVEHILGAASLQLAFAAASKFSALDSEPPTEVSPIRVARSMDTTRAHRPWGYGSGPFAGVSATGADIFEREWGGEAGAKDGVSSIAENDENFIIEQLEDEGTPWPDSSKSGSAAANGAVDSVGSDVGDLASCDGKGAGGESRARARAALAAALPKAMMHLTRAASRARWGRSWIKTEGACGLLWNAILSLWLSPQDFRLEDELPASGSGGAGSAICLGGHDALVYAKASEVLLDAVDAVNSVQTQVSSIRSGGNVPGIGGEGEEFAVGSEEGSADGKGRQSVDDKIERGTKAGIDHNPKGGRGSPSPPDAQWVARFVEWGLQGILRCRRWGVVVKVGSRLLASTGGLHGGHRIYSLVLYAQKRLCSLAASLLSTREARLESMDANFQAAQAKKRRRKVLRAVETKSKDEIEHERAREPLVEAVGDARVRKQIHDHRLGTLLQARDTYMKDKKIGRSTLDGAREALAEYLALLSPASPDDEDAGDPDHPVDLEKSLKGTLKLYGRAVDVLRQKRERELLTEALCDMGDLHALHGKYELAAKCWTDAIDGLCSALDSVEQWRPLFDRLRSAHPSPGGPPGGGGSLARALGGWSCLAGGTILGKLSIFTGQADMNGQLNLCLMAAELFRAPMEVSLPFPQRECDYASYTPETLGGPGLEGKGLWTDDRRLSAPALSASLMHVQEVLCAAGRAKEAFPVLAILEHVASRVTMDPLQLVQVKLARAECLAEAGLPGEASSALAGVLSGGSMPKTTGDYAGRRRASGLGDDAETAASPAASEGKGKKGSKDKKGEQAKGKNAPSLLAASDSSATDNDNKALAKSGLPFYGFAPFHNNLPLGHPDNAAAVSWLIGDAGAADGNPGATAQTHTADGSGVISRHFRILKRGLFGVDPTLEELHGENESCCVARARARLLLALANCNAVPSVSEDPTTPDGGKGAGGNDTVLRRVRDAADCILGEVLQVILKRISPVAIAATSAGTLASGRSGKSGTQSSSGGDSVESEARTAGAAAAAAQLTATAPGEVDDWAPPMAADALLIRGRLALLDGKLRVCRHHASRGLAVLLRHGLGGHGAPTVPVPRVTSVNSSDDHSPTQGASKRASIAFGGEQRQPWKVVNAWLELRHDLAVVALLQGRTADAIFQIRNGLDEATAVGEVVIGNRLRRLKAQAAVAEGELEEAVTDCRTLITEYQVTGTSALDFAAVLRLLAKIRRQQSLVHGDGEQEQTLLLLTESLEALRLADSTLLSAANGLGWIGTGTLTYAAREDNLMAEDAQPRLLQALGTSFQDLPYNLPGEVGFGLAPTDELDKTAPSSLVNLHLPTLRLLLAVRLSLLEVMQGIGQHNAGRQGGCETSEDEEEVNAGGSGETEEAGANGEGCWLSMASIMAEEAAALMRHVASPHPAVRAHLLLLIGKIRLRRLQTLRASRVAKTEPGGVTALPWGLERALEKASATALTAALCVSFGRGGHDWRVMGDACLGLVMLHAFSDGSGAIAHGDHGDSADADGLKPTIQHKLELVSYYLQLAASISSGHRLLDIELDSIASDPLPPAVIEAMPRSALDELAGRGGRGAEDDPMRLSARGLLQFLRARIREKSLAAAPADLLPASAVCQIHALLYDHVPAYREKCCVDKASLDPPSREVAPGSSSAAFRGRICVQWIWGDPHHENDKANASGTKKATGVAEDHTLGLYPTRTAIVYLEPPAACSGLQDAASSAGTAGHSASIAIVRVPATKADELRQRASQLKTLWVAFKMKAPAVETPPPSLQHRFDGLLGDAADALQSDTIPCPLAAALVAGRGAMETTEGGAAIDSHPDLTLANIETVEGVFDTTIGINVENEQVCRFVLATTAV